MTPLTMHLESDHSVKYEETAVSEDSQEIFSKGLPIQQALQKLRARLLDLSTRNRLLNFKFPKRKSIQFVGVKNLDVLYDRILDGRQALLKPVPEPDPNEFPLLRNEKIDAREHAKTLGLRTSYDLEDPVPDQYTGRRGTVIQTLFYPAEIERLARKISTEARTVIEETGSNMLYLVFGFLEFYESDASERPLLAPLLSVPVSLTRGEIDPVTNIYRYYLAYTGEDVAENYTVREKLKQDFRLHLPEFGEEDTPESYFNAVRQMVQKKRRWKVRRQLCLAMLSFGKLALWADLDPNKWPGLLSNDLLKILFEGSNDHGDGEDLLMAEDYDIDNHLQADLPVIYDADSSQHSALIDAFAGKNMVINGPPGTGKSQTISNIIASALQAGKKVLFVSEKLAALEVVRKRLDRANLGHFCLELHSHKTRKKKFLEDLQARLDQKFPPQIHLSAKLAVLTEQKKKLKRHAELMGMQVANHLGMTVTEVLWAAEWRRQKLGDLEEKIHSLTVNEAWDMDHNAFELRRSLLSDVGEKYRRVGGYDRHHPWWGFWPNQLAPGDEKQVGEIVAEAHSHAEALVAAVQSLQSLGQEDSELSVEEIQIIAAATHQLPALPDNLIVEQLSSLFGPDLSDKPSQKALTQVTKLVAEIKTARSIQRAILLPEANPSTGDLKSAEELVSARIGSLTILRSELIERSLQELNALRVDIEVKTDDFSQQIDTLQPKFEAINPDTLSAVSQALSTLATYTISEVPLVDLSARETALRTVGERLQQALAVVSEKAAQWHLDFDGTAASVQALANPEGLADLVQSATADDATVNEAGKWASSPFADKKLNDIETDLHTLHGLILEAQRAHDALAKCAHETGQPYNGMPTSVSELACIAKVAHQAPEELLPYRRKQFEHPQHSEMLKNTRCDHEREARGRKELADTYYLDALPSVDELKWAVRVFREGDSIFNIFKGDWRRAKKLFKSVAQTKAKLPAEMMAKECLRIAEWEAHRISFVGNRDYTEWFGDLFRGVETDFEKIERLSCWYRNSAESLLACGSLSERIELTTLEHKRIGQLAARGKNIASAAQQLSTLDEQIAKLLPINANPRELLESGGWQQYIDGLKSEAEQIQNLLNFFKAIALGTISPSRALELLQAKRDLAAAGSELSVLIHGGDAISQAAGAEFTDLALHSSRPWPDRIEAVLNLATQLGTLTDLLERFVQDSASPKTAICLLNSKIILDQAIEEASAVLPRTQPASWHEYLEFARSLARRMASLSDLGRFADAGRSVSAVLKAINAKVSADNKDELLATDPELQQFYGVSLQSEYTDIQALEATWHWGSAVVNSPLPSFIKIALFNEEVRETFSCLKEQAYGGIEAFNTVQGSLEKLGRFGVFHWDAWFQQSSGDGGRLPSNIEKRIQLAVETADEVLPCARYFDARRDCEKHALIEFVKLLEDQLLPSELLETAFERVFFASIGKEIYQRHHELSRFSGQTHEKLRADFMALDREIIELNGIQIAHHIDTYKVVPPGTTGVRASDRSELHLILCEIGKSRRHIPIRQLIKRAGGALQALKPCFMMGPLSVAQYLEHGSVEFDLIVMDEASQLRPEDALGAVARGKQLIVVGDPKQLPPTSFFDRTMDGIDDDGEEAPAALEGSESILDICQQLFNPVRTLRWHYRSRHESLIAFSNFHFYKNRMVVFPSPYERGRHLGVSWRYVKEGSYENRRNIPEAIRIVDTVIEHMVTHPEESLGVVSLNQTQRDLIQELLEKKLKSFREGERYLATWEEKGLPFFVKNLENVQGDERDVIYISTTFGKAPGTNKPRQNFGPISRSDGWRRLNVLFTRARLRLFLFSSMQPEDIIVDEKTPKGTRALRDYLDFAKRGILVATDYAEREPDSDFEISVANVLMAQGYEVKPQLGVANFFIDLAVRNPDRRGEFLAGIECDGATYHCSASARDRDRIRQEFLEELGWKGRIWRIWSADWFYNPRQEIRRLIDFIEERRRLSALEKVPLFEEDIFDVEYAEEHVGETEAEETVEVDSIEADEPEAEDAFADIGNVVTYCFLDTPKERHTIKIVEGHSTAQGTVGEDAPLAISLLGLEVGEVGIMSVKGRPDRKVRLLKIEREAIASA